MVQCGIKCVNFKQGCIKIIGFHFSYDKNLEQEQNLCEHITETENILKVWRMRQLLIERLTNVFKLLAVWKVRHTVPVTKLHSSTIEQLCKLPSLTEKNTKIKHETFCNNFQNGSLKNIGISSKTTSMQCPLVKGLSEEDFYGWKVIPRL